MCPITENISPTKDNNEDYVVITLSPVNSNGEPLENNGSPEIFTEDKNSPVTRNVSPPIASDSMIDTNLSSSLSLIKKPPLRSRNRAAQMLGLCIPDISHSIKASDVTKEIDEKKSTVSMPGRRNLRILYASNGDNAESSDDNDLDFLRLEKPLPSATSSPAGPILKCPKRKLVEIDEPSPASKRKRVSFHDPPVSTTVTVQKYIEPFSLPSPSKVPTKRLDKQTKSPAMTPKRLDNSFKLDTVLTKAAEDFCDVNTPTDDTQLSSLEQTPAVEIVKTSELNDIDAICPVLTNCEDPIENIACELSSPAMKVLLVKEFVGKVETIGDLAKMTELEINRLRIKAPKVTVAKEVLNNYCKKISIRPEMETDEPEVVESRKAEVEIPTDRRILTETFIQTGGTRMSECHTQTDSLLTCTQFVQTNESGEKPIEQLVKMCLANYKREEFVDQLRLQLDQSSTKQIASKLPTDDVTDLLSERLTNINTSDVLDKLLSHLNSNDQMIFFKNHLWDRMQPNDLMSFCIETLQRIHEQRQ